MKWVSTQNKYLNHLILILMLESLHLALWFESGTALSRALLLVHFGLFLLWQPIWKSDESFSYLNGGLFIIFTLALIYWINPAVTTAWLVLLIGFLGGIIKHRKEESITFLTALGFLIMECLFRSAPATFSIELQYPIDTIVRNILFILPLLILFFPAYEHRLFHVDLFRAISSSLLISLLLFGSLLNTLLSDFSYQDALVQSIMILAAGLLGISWLLSPKFGFSGLSQLWSQSLLNIGTPFERWMSTIAGLQQTTREPEEFVDASMKELMNLEWVAGVSWTLDNIEHQEGNRNSNVITIDLPSFITRVYTHQLTGSAMQIHCNMLIKMIETMYVAKLNEQQSTEQAYLRSVYETGARITHDIKNLLQSLKVVTRVIQTQSDTNKERQSIELLKRQLPDISRRLELALDKLQTPQMINNNVIKLSDWLVQNQNRISYEIDSNEDFIDREIPEELFDSMLSNMLDNVQRKKQEESDVNLSIELISTDKQLRLLLTDTGKAIPKSLANNLFSKVIESKNGLGIGLYQLSKMAELYGYAIRLTNNEEGKVRFELSSIFEAEKS